MCPMLRYPRLQPLLSPFRRSQQKTLAPVIGAVTERAQANSLAVARPMAVEPGTQLGGALTRLSQLLRNPRLDDQPPITCCITLSNGCPRATRLPSAPRCSMTRRRASTA
jgi:hypothetical protein